MKICFIKKIDNIITRVFLLVLINSIFYVANFSTVLDSWNLPILILASTILELILFLIPNIKSALLRFLHAFLYFFLSFSKIFMGINFFQYGNCDIFARLGQIKYLSDTCDYFIAQINALNISIAVLSLLSAILIYHNIDVDFRQHSNSILIMLIIYSISFFLLKENVYFEYYRTLTHSFFNFYDKEALDENLMSKKTDQIIANSIKDYKKRDTNITFDKENLFKSYKNKNAFTNLTKDKNIIIIQVESLQNLFIGRKYKGKEICPNLNRLLKNSIYFTDYFELIGLGNSSDSEYVSLHRPYSNLKNGAYIDYSNTEIYGLPVIAKLKGYKTISMHGNSGKYYGRNVFHPMVGFDKSYFGEDFDRDELIGMGLSDASFFRQAAPILKQSKNEKFLAFLITVTSHVPYNMPKQYQVFDTDLSTNFDRYLDAVHYADASIGQFLEDLDKDGLLDNTVVAIYGDHHALSVRDKASVKKLNDFLGYDFDYDEMFNIPLIIYSKDFTESHTYGNIGSQLDFMPTMMNLMGWNDFITPMFGVDLLDEKMSKNNIVYPQTYVPNGSSIDDKILFVNDLLGRNIYYIKDRKNAILINSPSNYDIKVERNYTIDFANYIYENDKVKYMIDEFKKGISE